MSYASIENLYKNQEILMFKECYAMEKIHGTSAHIQYIPEPKGILFFAGGANHESFVKLFDSEVLKKIFDTITPDKKVTVYGEAYGGKLMGMRDTYGDTLRFVVFEVNIDDCWLNVPKAEEFTHSLGLEFVHYNRIPTTMEAIDAERDADSVQAVRNGMGSHIREGIVLRPIEEVTLNSGKRVIAKHKRDEFKETTTPRKVISEERLKVLADAKAIANEWVTRERLVHVLDKNQIEPRVENTGKVISCMSEDIIRESAGEIVDSSDARKEIARLTALMFKEYVKQ